MGRELKLDQATHKARPDLLRFDPFSSRSSVSTSSELLRSSTRPTTRSTMRSQHFMLAARLDQQRAPEYVIQDMQEGAAYSSRHFDPFSKYEGDVFRQCRQPETPPPLETLLMDRLHPRTGGASMVPNTQFSGFSARDFMSLSANSRLGVELFRSDNASQEHMILARSSDGPVPSSMPYLASETVGENDSWDSLSTTTRAEPTLPSITFAEEYKALMATIFNPNQQTISAAALEAELFRFGSIVQERIFDVPSFLQSSWSRQDLVILGLERTVQEAMAERVTMAEKVRLAELLCRHDMQDLLSMSTLNSWKHLLMQAPKKEFRKAGIEKTAWRSRLDATLERIRAHKGMTKNAWEARTMPFRTKLAIFRKSGILPTKHEYHEFMLLGLKAERYDQVYQAFHHLVEHGGVADTRLYTMYITALVRQGRMDHAVEVLRGMERMNVKPSVVTYGVMIDGYGRQQDGAGMLSTLEAMQRAGIEPNLPIFSSLLANLIRGKEFHKALKVHDQLIASKLELDDTTKNSLIKLLQHTKGSQAAYTSLLERLEVNKNNRPYSSKGESQDVPTTDSCRNRQSGELAGFNKALDGFADAMDVAQFTAAYTAMRQRGLDPNLYTYNTLLKFYRRAGSRLQNSLNILKTMNAKYPSHQDVVAYTTVMQHAAAMAAARAHSQGMSSPNNSTSAPNTSGNSNNGGNGSTDAIEPIEVAWNLYDEMMQKQVRLDLKAYVTLIDLIGQDPTSAQARAMIRQHFIAGPHRLGFTVSPECDRATGLGLAGILYVQLLNQGLEPNEHVFGSMMNLVIRRGYIREVEAVYTEMVARRGMAPNTALLTNLIQGFSHVRDFEAGWKVWEFMVANNIPRNAITYSHLIRLCERCFHPNYLEAMRWQHQQQQQRLQDEASDRLEDSMPEFDRYGVRIERFGEDAIKFQQLKAERNSKTNRALGLSHSADRVVAPSGGFIDRYGLPSSRVTATAAAAASAAVTSTTRDGSKKSKFREWVPEELCEAIDQQMKADGVSWSKVQRFCKGIREMKPWDPIVAKVEQLRVDASAPSTDKASTRDHSAVQSDSSLSSPTSSASEVSNLSSALSYEPLTGGHGESTIATLDVAGPGLGHGYIPQRTLPPNIHIEWDSEAQMPVLCESMAGKDAEFRPLDSKEVLRRYPFLASNSFEWWKTYRAGAKASSSFSATTSEQGVGEDHSQQKADRNGAESHAKRVRKMEKRRVKVLQARAKSLWTNEAVQQLEEEERAYAIPGRP
ncbi:hypothetical protein BGW42_003629 [Actinomortierella wolfii]|nr:hypothetical protein BGW42_003629 [Actinomortierella wolfii]